MGKIKGSLFIMTEDLEIARINADNRDKSVCDFLEMKFMAERHTDQIYVLQEVFSHSYSYGNIYSGFLYLSWSEFHEKEMLKGISQKTHQMIQSFSKNPRLIELDSENTFLRKENPHAHTGFINTQGHEDFVNDLIQWEEWHRNWYIEHQDEIDWSNTYDDWFPRKDLIIKLLRKELLSNFLEKYTLEMAQRMVDAIPNADVVHKFHDIVMKHKGNELEGYASKIGDAVCRHNYYIYENELSAMEQQHAKSLRKIYSIINRYGKRQFISIDFGHGMFEFHDENGEHLGEYRFDGSANSPKETNHSFKCMAQWHKQMRK